MNEMDPSITAAIVGAIGAVVAAIIGAVIARRKDKKKDSSAQIQYPSPPSAPTTDPTSQKTPRNGPELINATFGRNQSERAARLSSLTISTMKQFEYSEEAIAAFETVYSELVTNALEYGCRSSGDTISITIDANATYVALKVMNPRGREFDLESSMERSRKSLTNDPNQRRGRGLLLAMELADVLEGTPDKEGVKAVFFKDRVLFKVESRAEKDLTVIATVNGLHNPSFKRRLLKIAKQYLQDNLILDFRGWVTSTVAYYVILELSELYSRTGRRIVALIDSPTPTGNESEVILPDAIIAYSWEEALRKIFNPSSSDLQPDPQHMRRAYQFKEVEEERTGRRIKEAEKRLDTE